MGKHCLYYSWFFSLWKDVLQSREQQEHHFGGCLSAGWAGTPFPWLQPELLKCPVLPRMVVSPLNGGRRLSPWFGSSEIPCWDNWKLAWCGRAELDRLEMLMGVWGMWMSWRTTYLHLGCLEMSPWSNHPSFHAGLEQPGTAGANPTTAEEALSGWSPIFLFSFLLAPSENCPLCSLLP